MSSTYPERVSAAINVQTIERRRREARPQHKTTWSDGIGPGPLRGQHLVEFLVAEFHVAGLPLSEHAIRRMLTDRLIPGVQKFGTGRKSHWFAPDPSACVRRYLAGERGDRRVA